MKVIVRFAELGSGFVAKFGDVQNISDGGFERGYAAGYEKGNTEGYVNGHADGVQQGYMDGYNTGLSDGSRVLSAVLGGASVETLDDDNVTFIKQYGLANDSTLKTVKFRNMTSGGTSCFQNSKALETVDLPSLKRVPYTAFSGCTALKNVNIPIATLDYAPFNGCSALERLDLNANVDYINALSFQNTSLTVLILRVTKKVATLNNINAFNGTPIKNGTGYIYVPAALVGSYKAATNWSTYATQFRALEDYTVDGTTTGALDESKV